MFNSRYISVWLWSIRWPFLYQWWCSRWAGSALTRQLMVTFSPSRTPTRGSDGPISNTGASVQVKMNYMIDWGGIFRRRWGKKWALTLLSQWARTGESWIVLRINSWPMIFSWWSRSGWLPLNAYSSFITICPQFHNRSWQNLLRWLPLHACALGMSRMVYV